MGDISDQRTNTEIEFCNMLDVGFRENAQGSFFISDEALLNTPSNEITNLGNVLMEHAAKHQMVLYTMRQLHGVKVCWRPRIDNPLHPAWSHADGV